MIHILWGAQSLFLFHTSGGGQTIFRHVLIQFFPLLPWKWARGVAGEDEQLAGEAGRRAGRLQLRLYGHSRLLHGPRYVLRGAAGDAGERQAPQPTPF